jgi:very-short-patch-repair endonuclease
VTCSKCNGLVSKKEYNFSSKNFGQILCKECQEKYFYYKTHFEKVKRKTTPQALKLQQALIKLGYDARLEQWDKHKHIDLAIPDKKVNIELDGPQHQGEKQALTDLKRTYHSWKLGYFTLRIPNVLMDKEAYVTAGYIKAILDSKEEN